VVTEKTDTKTKTEAGKDGKDGKGANVT
jgi:hypothetical protein